MLKIHQLENNYFYQHEDEILHSEENEQSDMQLQKKFEIKNKLYIEDLNTLHYCKIEFDLSIILDNLISLNDNLRTLVLIKYIIILF